MDRKQLEGKVVRFQPAPGQNSADQATRRILAEAFDERRLTRTRMRVDEQRALDHRIALMKSAVDGLMVLQVDTLERMVSAISMLARTFPEKRGGVR